MIWEENIFLDSKQSGNFDLPMLMQSFLYFLFRMAPHIDEPFRSRAIQALTKTIAYRKLPFPIRARPFNIPSLDHDTFRSSLKRALVGWIKEQQQHWVPLHWPSSTIIEGRQKTTAQILHNWRPAMRVWTTQPPVECNCKMILEKYPDLAEVNGHIAGALASDRLPKKLQFL